MEEDSYIYQMKPLIIPGLIFLFIYPLVVGLVYFATKFSRLELILLNVIYFVTFISILVLWIYAKSKHVIIENNQIIFKTLLGEYTLEPYDIRRVVFYWNAKGQEIAQIWTKRKTFYLSEAYFPFPELMSDLESFIDEHSIRTNMTGHMTR